MKTISIWLIIVLLSGCTIVGPSSISNGRIAYNEVINYTEDQQLLNAIVRLRYGQTFSMLSISSITANVKFHTGIKSQFQAWGSDADIDGNLTPLSIGLSYEENPTVSYTPVQGEFVLRRLASPISVEEGFLLVAAAKEQSIAERIIFKKLNHHFLPDNFPPSPETLRLLSLAETFRHKGISHVGRVKDHNSNQFNYLIILSGYTKADYTMIKEALNLLGIRDHIVDGRLISLSFSNDLILQNSSINVKTRSVLDWLHIAGNLIDVPQAHLQAGLLEASTWSGADKHRIISIHSSQSQPDNSVVSIKFRNWWFYIDETDSRSKNSFWLFKLLVGMRLKPTELQHQPPLLTVPVN